MPTSGSRREVLDRPPSGAGSVCVGRVGPIPALSWRPEGTPLHPCVVPIKAPLCRACKPGMAQTAIARPAPLRPVCLHHIPKRRDHTERAGAVTQHCALQTHIPERLLARQIAHRLLRAVEEEVRGPCHNAAAEDDHLRVEDVDVVRQRDPEVGAGLIEQAARVLITGTRGVRDLVRVKLAALALDALQSRRFASVDQLLGTPGKAGSGRNGLQTAAIPAKAARAVEPDDHMSQLARSACGAVVDLTVDDYAATDARAYCEIDQVACPSAGPEAVFAERRGVGVVLQQYRQAQALAHDLDQWDPVPPGQLRRLENTAVHEVERPRRGYADGSKAGYRQARRRRGLLERLDHARDYAVGSFVSLGGADDLAANVPFEISDDGAEFSTAEVDRPVQVRHGLHCKTADFGASWSRSWFEQASPRAEGTTFRLATTCHPARPEACSKDERSTDIPARTLGKGK